MDDELSDTVNFRNTVSPQSRRVELTENFGPNTERCIDEGIVLDRSVSFSEQSAASGQSAASEMTATPLHRKDLKIRPNTANMLWFSGLRGAVAYACVRTFPDNLGHQKDFTMTTMAIVLVTVFLLGGTTELALTSLKINVGVDEEKFMKDSLREPVVSSAISNFGEKQKVLSTTFSCSALHLLTNCILR
jgi:hypothetical protein